MNAVRFLLLLCAIVCVLVPACGGPDVDEAAPDPVPRIEALPFDESELKPERGRFASVTDPAAVLPNQAPWLHMSDEVVGVVVDGAARAYPVWMIAFHHAINDRLGKTPVLVTY